MKGGILEAYSRGLGNHQHCGPMHLPDLTVSINWGGGVLFVVSL